MKVSLKLLTYFTISITALLSVSQCDKLVTKRFKDGGIYTYPICDEPCQEIMSGFLSHFAGWDFNYIEKGDLSGKRDNLWNFHWVSALPPGDIENWTLLQKTNELANKLGNDSYQLADSFAVLTRFGDKPNIMDRFSNDTSDILMVIHFSAHPVNKSCSELVFYDKNEIYRVIPARGGEVVAWLDMPSYTLRPPCCGTFIAGRHLFLRYKLKTAGQSKGDAEQFEDPGGKTNLIGLPVTPLKAINVVEYLTNQFYDSKGCQIAVFDGLFCEDDLHRIRKAVLRKNSFHFADHQSEEGDDYDNVSWMSSFQINGIFKSKVWSVIKAVVTFLSGESEWYPYDVANNVIERMSHTRIHEDCEGKEESEQLHINKPSSMSNLVFETNDSEVEGIQFEYTFLLYLNPVWNENKYGETIFLEKTSEQEDEYETIAAVKPKFGRVCIFRNIISHSARPPSPDFDGARFTFAVKLSRTKKIGLTKIFREALEDWEGEEKEMFAEKLHKGTIEGQDIDLSENQLQDAFSAFETKRSASNLEEYQKIIDTLLGKA